MNFYDMCGVVVRLYKAVLPLCSPVEVRCAACYRRTLSHCVGRRAGSKLEWKSPLTVDDIRKYPDPVLRAPNAKVGVFGEPLKALAAEMFDVMYKCASLAKVVSGRAQTDACFGVPQAGCHAHCHHPASSTVALSSYTSQAP